MKHSPNFSRNLTKKKILEQVSQLEIMERYLGWKIDRRKKYVSPFRADKKADCTFFISKSNTLYLNDWAKGEQYDCFQIVMHYFQCNFFEALKIIDQDFGLNLYAGTFSHNAIKREKKLELTIPKKEYKFVCTVQDFTSEELKYWNQYDINEETLKKYNVFSVRYASKNSKPYMRTSKGNPIFGYFFDSTEHVKLYRPLTTNNDKWRGNTTRSDINGLVQLEEKGDLLIITKSLKDVMCLYNLGYQAIAPQGENQLFSEDFISKLYQRFEKIVVLFDNDEPGIKAATKYLEKRNLPNIFLDTAKDISDLIKEKGSNYAKKELEDKISSTRRHTSDLA